MRHIGAIIVTVILLGVLPVWADVVELKTGQRVEGNFKEATARGVVIEVGGQAIAFPREKVRAIYFGPVPAPTQPSAIQEALRALKALQSVTSAGVNYRDYAPRVGDAKIQVDRYVSEPKGTIAETRSAIAAAMGFYILASSAWSASMTNDWMGYDTITRDALFVQCPQAKHVINVFLDKGYRLIEPARPAMHALWACASEKIAEAERPPGK